MVGVVTAWLLCLPASLIVMCVAAYVVLRDGSQAQSASQLTAAAAAGCQLGAVSSVLLALAGLGCLGGAASMLGWAMIVLGLLGTAAAWLFFRRYLAETDRPRSVRYRAR